MIRKLFPNLREKEKTGFWLLGQKTSLAKFFFYLLILFLPIQLGYHFWPKFSYVYGLRIDYLSPTLYLTDIFILCILFFYFQKQVKIIKKNLKKTLLILLFLIVLGISAFFSTSPFAAVYGIIKLIEFLLLGVFIFTEIRIDKKIIYLLTVSVIYESLISIAQFLNQSSLNGIFYFLGERSFTGQTPGIANTSLNGEMILRPYATFSHPNVLAGFLVIMMTILLIQFFKQKVKKLILFTLTIGTVALFLTLSRAAIFLWVILVPFIILTKENINRKTIFIFFILFVIFLSIFFYTNLFLRFNQINLTDESVVSRQLFLKESFELFLKKPLFGIGVNNFIPSLPNITRPSGLSSLQPVHNIFILNLTETGIIGFLFFVSFLVITIKKVYKKSFLILPLLSIFFLGFFDHYFLTLQQGQIIFTLILSLCWAKEDK